jgi:hypothetical protein
MSQEYRPENSEDYPAPRWVQDDDGFYYDTQPDLPVVPYEPKPELPRAMQVVSNVGATVIVTGIVILVAIIVLALIIKVVGWIA